MTSGSWREVLHAEAEARQGTFTLAVRSELTWKTAEFAELELAMREACAELEGIPTIDRWLVTGFWLWCNWIPEWTMHPNFPRPDADYFARCLERLSDLEQWFFVLGESPYLEGHVWEAL